MSRGTPQKCIRLSDDLWARFDQAAKAAGTTRTDLLRQWIMDYVAAAGHEQGKPPASVSR